MDIIKIHWYSSHTLDAELLLEYIQFLKTCDGFAIAYIGDLVIYGQQILPNFFMPKMSIFVGRQGLSSLILYRFIKCTKFN